MPWRLTEAAEIDLFEITASIAERDPRAAARVLARCIERFEMFVRQPEIGERCDELAERLRRFTVGVYVIYYRMSLETDAVEIVRVVHGARDIDTVFREP